jgi:hypothetical protein
MVLAWTTITRPYVSGTRGFARWSGNTTRSVREVTGPDGQTSKSGFLWTATRGTASALADERDSMELTYSDSRTQGRSTSYNLSLPRRGQEEALALEALALKNSSSGNAPLSARIPERAQRVLDEGLKVLDKLNDMNGTTASGKILTMLDPGLDVWAEIEGEKPAYVAYEPLGRRAWSLAVFCGIQNVVLAVEDIESITGLSKRGVQVSLKRMTEANPLLVRKVRQGRSFLYEIAWFDVLHPAGEYFEQAVARDEIRRKRAAKDAVVQETSARRGTGPGYLAFLHSSANAKREQYLADNPLPDNCLPEWRELVERGDETELYEYLRAREEAAPSSPEGLDALMATEAPESPLSAFVRKQAEARKTQPATKDSDLTKLTAMRQRILMGN